MGMLMLHNGPEEKEEKVALLKIKKKNPPRIGCQQRSIAIKGWLQDYKRPTRTHESERNSQEENPEEKGDQEPGKRYIA